MPIPPLYDTLVSSGLVVPSPPVFKPSDELLVVFSLPRPFSISSGLSSSVTVAGSPDATLVDFSLPQRSLFLSVLSLLLVGAESPLSEVFLLLQPLSLSIAAGAGSPDGTLVDFSLSLSF